MKIKMAADVDLVIKNYRRHASAYDCQIAGGGSIRRRALEKLHLKPGDIVFDVGCGTGINFPLIEASIGVEGQLVGIDLSPDMLAKAHEKVDSRGWQNVTLIQSAIENVNISVDADAVIFSFTHDIIRSVEAIENIFRHLKRLARVVSAGAKWAPWWAAPVNIYVWYRSRQYIQNFEGFGRPWTHLERFVPDLRVEVLLLGRAYIAWGEANKANVSAMPYKRALEQTK